MIIEYETKNAREHAAGGKEHGWSKKEHEAAMLAEMGMHGWIMCGVCVPEYSCSLTYYFYRKIRT